LGLRQLRFDESDLHLSAAKLPTRTGWSVLFLLEALDATARMICRNLPRFVEDILHCEGIERWCVEQQRFWVIKFSARQTGYAGEQFLRLFAVASKVWRVWPWGRKEISVATSVKGMMVDGCGSSG
jgi:hypothetical protein